MIAPADRVLVTGASGFVGGHLVERLRGDRPGAAILAIGGPQEADGLDLLDAHAVDARIRDFAPTVVVHLAAASSVAQTADAPLAAWDINVMGLRNLAVALARSPDRVRLIFPSSAEVYGRAFLTGPCDEDTPPQPASSYGRTKLAGELMLRDLAGPGLQVVALRLFNHTGPGQDTRFVVPGFADQIVRLEPSGGGAIRVGNLDAQRDFTDVADIIDAYMAVAFGPDGGPDFALYNVGSGEPRSIRSVLDALLALSDADIRVEIDPDRLRPSEIPVAQGLFSRFATDYGWRPTHPFAGVLARVLDDRRTRLRKAGFDEK